MIARLSTIVLLGLLAAGPGCAVKAEPPPTTAAPDSGNSVTLHVDGMYCAACPFTVKTALTRLDGVKSAVVDRSAKTAVVVFEPGKVTAQQMIDAVNKLGYPTSLASGG